VADFQLKVVAETQRAEKDLQRLDKTANEATKERKIKLDVPSIGQVSKNFSDLSKNLETAANDIKKFYGVARQLPGIGQQIQSYEKAVTGTAKTANALASNTKAGEILAHSFEKATSAAGSLVNDLAKVGFALFGIKEIVGVLQNAFGGLFNQTIGREIKLRETILKTQTTLASTAKVFKNGTEITDPYQKIVSLTGAVRKNIDSIRERSIALAGVTSGEVIEVFGIVASQISQIGGGLKEAEDLAINFAAALGTFGIPLYQARQEIGSILRGDITTDSYLAKALGITNEDVAKAKTQAGGLVKFLEDRLAAAVAGQKIAAQGFSGIVSNIRDLAELLGQRFGAALLDPLLNVLAAVFENLFRIKEQIFAIADGAGQVIGRVSAVGREIRSRAGMVSLGEIGLKDDSGQKALNNIQDAFQDVTVLIEGAAQRAIGAIAQAINTLKPSVRTVADAFIRLGKVFIEIKVDTFEALARVLANLITAATPLLATFTTLFNLYSRFLDLPVIQEFAKLSATMGLLKRAGMDLVTNAILIGNTLFRVVIPAVGALGTTFGVVVGGVGAVVLALGKLTLTLAGLTAAMAGVPGIAAGVAKALVDVSKNLSQSGQQSIEAGNNINTVAGGFKNLGETAKLAGLNIVKSLGWTLLIQAAVTVAVNAVGEFQKASEDITRQKRAELALTRLSSVYRNVGDDADYATKAARDFEQQLAQAEYGRVIERLEEIRKKLNDMRYEAQISIQTWGEFFRLFDIGRTLQRARGLSPDSVDAAKLIGEEQRLRDYKRKYEAEQNKKSAEENIRLEANNRKNMEQEIKDIRLRQENELFSKRQELAQKEVDIFRAAGELRIFQMEQANKKMMEGQEGASAAAMDALNTYLSIRERGELEIEAAKKQLVVEVANMEREIENYKLENAKTIAKIRKESAQYEENVAKNVEAIKRNGAQAQASPAPTEGFRVGSTGRSTGPHLDIRSPTGDANAVINEAMTIVKAWQAMGIAYIQLSNTGENVKGVSDDARLRAALKREQQAHATRARGGAIDIAVPSGTLVPRRTGTPSWDGGGGGWMATSLDTGNIFLHGLQSSIASRGSAPTPVSTQAPNFDAIGTTEAKTKAAFEEIAKAAFPRAQVEQYKDQLIEAQLSLKAFASSKSDAYDPDRAAIEVRYQKELLIMDRERKEIQEAAAKAEGVKKAELVELEKKITEQIEKRKKDLTEIKNLEGQILAITRAQTVIESLRKSFKDNTKDIRNQQNDLMVGTRMQLEGFSPEQIDTQMKVIAAAREYDAKNTEIQKDIAVAEDAIATKRAAGTAVTAQEIQTLNNLKKSLEDARVEYNSNILAIQGFAAAQQAAKTALAWQVDNRWESAWGGMKQGLEEYAASLGTLKSQMQDFTKNTLGAMSNAFVELLTTGTTNFRQLAANILTDLTRIIFQTMVLKPLLKALASPLGGGSMFGFASGGIMTSNGPLPLRSYAGGGIANSPQVALFGEGSKPEAFVPLPDGKSIPVSFDRSGATSSGNVSVNVNVDAKGTQAQGDSKKSEQIGKVIASAVQEEILRMKRPGGLLAS